MLQPPPKTTLFPYTTLFRSLLHEVVELDEDVAQVLVHARGAAQDRRAGPDGVVQIREGELELAHAGPELVRRSEEHTSELQSRRDLVCRLLLEKKKAYTMRA